jgi:hypothetical protein
MGVGRQSRQDDQSARVVGEIDAVVAVGEGQHRRVLRNERVEALFNVVCAQNGRALGHETADGLFGFTGGRGQNERTSSLDDRALGDVVRTNAGGMGHHEEPTTEALVIVARGYRCDRGNAEGAI